MKRLQYDAHVQAFALHDAETRTTAQGLFNFGRSYQRAADQLMPTRNSLRFQAPIRMLYWHASELALKSFLRANGLSLSQLQALRHDQSRIGRRCIDCGWMPPVAVVQMLGDGEAQDLLSLRYLRTGAIRELPIELIAEGTCAVFDSLLPEMRRLGHHVR